MEPLALTTVVLCYLVAINIRKDVDTKVNVKRDINVKSHIRRQNMEDVKTETVKTRNVLNGGTEVISSILPTFQAQ